MIRAALAQAETLFDHLQVQNRQPRHVGRLVSHDAGMLEVTGFRRPIGSGARVLASDGSVCRAEVVGFRGDRTLLVPLDADAPIRKKWQVPQGITLGFYDGVAGPGTGAFWTVSTLLLYPIDLVRASGVARSMNFVSNIAALTVFIISGQVDYIVGLCMGLSVMVGAFFGARTAISGGSKFIRPVFITVVLALTVRLAWQHWFGQA